MLAVTCSRLLAIIGYLRCSFASLVFVVSMACGVLLYNNTADSAVRVVKYHTACCFCAFSRFSLRFRAARIRLASLSQKHVEIKLASRAAIKSLFEICLFNQILFQLMIISLEAPFLCLASQLITVIHVICRNGNKKRKLCSPHVNWKTASPRNTNLGHVLHAFAT